MYRTLQAEKIVETLDLLETRIDVRFAGKGLAQVCHELGEVARKTAERASRLKTPAYGMRTGIVVLLAAGIWLMAYIGHLLLEGKKASEDMFSLIMAVDAAINIFVLSGAMVIFLITLEERFKRRRALRDLNELRSFVHVIDMHQLTKDRQVLDFPRSGEDPVPDELSLMELTRYLNYCSQMLSITEKLAALYAQATDDPVVIDAASDLASLTTNLSSKIWQKITLIQTEHRERLIG